MKLSQREIIKKYAALMRDIATKDFYKIDLTNRVNCYVCDSCKQITKTKDVEAGVTPFMITCRQCKDNGTLARSTMYKDIAPDQTPEYEWYRPTLRECLKKKSQPMFLDHIFNGGLELRKIA